MRWLAIAGAGALLGPGTATADRARDSPAAVEVDREVGPAGRVGLGFDGGEPLAAWGASLAVGWVERPIALRVGAFGDGSPASQPVRRRETVALGGALVLGDRVVLDAALRASHQVGDRAAAAGDPDRLARFVVHDLRIGARIPVAGDDRTAALLRAELTLPTGSAEQFAGDASWTAAWCLIARASLARDIAIVANAGIRLHGAEVAVGDRVIGNALFAAAGAELPLPAFGLTLPAALTAALVGSLGDHVGHVPGPNPLEARLGAIARPRAELALAARVGVGLDDQIGAPSVRAVLEIAWTPQVERRAAPPAQREPDDDLDD